MQRRAVLRRAFPYLVIGIGGFALAYVLIYIFVLPSKILPPAAQPYVPDSSRIFRPIDTAATTATVPAEIAPSQPTVAIAPTRQAPVPVQAPDLIGMALPDARTILNGLRLRTVVERDTSSLQPPNTVLRQLPLPQANVPPSGIVTVTVSYFPADTSHVTGDSMPVQRGSTLHPIRSAEPDTARHPNF